ncbi:MAG: hypothetical protein AB7I30_07405, partial [Isosphaeraceae bacterium]
MSDPLRVAVAALAGTLLLGAGPAPGAEPTPIPLLQVRGVRPEVMVDRLIGLFEGSGVPHPAAALSAWKNAEGDKANLGKTLEALIAALNPAMVPELQALDGSRLRVVIEPENGRTHWCLIVPNDDGRFGGFARALALTDGASLEPLEGRPVLRVGPSGAPVAFAPPGPLVVASDLTTLANHSPTIDEGAATSPGWYARLDPAGLRVRPELSARRAGEALSALGVREVAGEFRLEGETLELDLTSRLETPLTSGAIEPSWLDALPTRGRLAAAAMAWEPGEPAVRLAFALADRVERADPARRGVAPLRTRLNLLATAARVNLETDFWPHLKGISGCLLVDPSGRPAGGLLGLHARSAEAAARISERILPRLGASYFRSESVVEGPATRRLGSLEGRVLLVATRGQSVWVSWGAEPLAEGPDAHEASDLSRTLGETHVQRFAALWLGALTVPGTPLARSLATAPPVVWTGGAQGAQAVDVLRWEGLRGAIHRG